jgi:hypothetical protein
MRWLARLAAPATLLLATCTATFAGTTGAIEGRVTDTEGHPLPNATISLISERVGLQTHSDAGGHYHFLSLYPDEYTLTVRRGGNFTFLSRPFEVHADQVTVCNVRLSPALTGLYITRRTGNRVVPCMF